MLMKNRLLRIDSGIACICEEVGWPHNLQEIIELLQITDRGLEETCQNKSFPATQLFPMQIFHPKVLGSF